MFVGPPSIDDELCMVEDDDDEDIIELELDIIEEEDIPVEDEDPPSDMSPIIFFIMASMSAEGSMFRAGIPGMAGIGGMPPRDGRDPPSGSQREMLFRAMFLFNLWPCGQSLGMDILLED